jgi:Coiled-coil domain-containing protein 55 (DUF2040)
MIQREREAEGDEFRDKEAFVTQAYKDQMAEVRRAEEEERKREGVYYMAIAPTSSQYIVRTREEAWVIWRHGTLLPQITGGIGTEA